MAKGVLKRYFPVILKPIVLTMLLFVMITWVYSMFASFSPEWYIIADPRLTEELRQQETARAGSLGSFIANLLGGNLGISFRTMRPVWPELLWRSVNTFLLIGISIIFSLLIGIGLSLLIKPGRRRPSTYTHSLRGFLFGLIPAIVLPALFLFSYCAYATLGFPIFPHGGMYRIPPPMEPIAYSLDVLWHLFLPTATLILITMIRNVSVIRSSGFASLDKPMLKRILLPCTTIDFTVMISASIIVEYIFSWPGAGQWFISSLWQGDWNVVFGSFLLFLVLAVCLGYISVLLDFFQRWTGLREDLEKKSPILPGTREAPINGGGWWYVKALLRRKKLVIGSAITLVFVFLGGFAPWIMPYDPVGSRMDAYAQLVYGARTAIMFVFPIIAAAVALGFPFGFLAGYFQGWADNFITPIFDAFLHLPVLLMVMIPIVLFSKSYWLVGMVSLPFLVALAALAFRNSLLVRSSNRKLGGKTPGEKVLDIFRNVLANLFFAAISLMLLLWTIDFIGLGDPTYPAWGRMLHYAYTMGAFHHLAWWQIFPPILYVALSAAGLLLLGMGLEDEGIHVSVASE